MSNFKVKRKEFHFNLDLTEIEKTLAEITITWSKF